MINRIKLILFATCLGGFSGAIVWVFLKTVGVFTGLIWETLPEKISFPGLTVIVCILGGLLIGLFHKAFGDYPKELHYVMEKVKKEGHYDYSHMPAMLIGAFLPLIFASSVGPEAGLTGVIVGLCYWVGDNLKYARERTKEYSEIGEAVTLGVLFHVPLFGIFAVEEEADEEVESKQIALPKPEKLILYGGAIAGGLAVNYLMTKLVGPAMAGFSSFDKVSLVPVDFAAMILYVAAGVVMAWLFEICEKISEKISDMLPAVICETVCGLVLGTVITFVPLAAFSGEEEMAELTDSFLEFTPFILISVALIKIFLTAFCIKLGMRGGHFFPLIFSCSCMGFGIATLMFGYEFGHLVFAAGTLTAACLGAQMKKPLAVAVLCLLCFPLKMLFFLFLAAAAGAFIMDSSRHDSKKGEESS